MIIQTGLTEVGPIPFAIFRVVTATVSVTASVDSAVTVSASEAV